MPRIAPIPIKPTGTTSNTTCNITVGPIPIKPSADDVQLKLLENKLVPKDLINNLELLMALDEKATIYVDNNGTHSRYLICDLYKIIKNIDFNQLSEAVNSTITTLATDIQKVEEQLATKQTTLIPDDSIIIQDNIIGVSNNYVNKLTPNITTIVNQQVHKLVVDGGEVALEGGIINAK